MRESISKDNRQERVNKNESFSKFYLRNFSRISTNYPFLGKNQIKVKLKQMWLYRSQKKCLRNASDCKDQSTSKHVDPMNGRLLKVLYIEEDLSEWHIKPQNSHECTNQTAFHSSTRCFSNSQQQEKTFRETRTDSGFLTDLFSTKPMTPKKCEKFKSRSLLYCAGKDSCSFDALFLGDDDIFS